MRTFALALALAVLGFPSLSSARLMDGGNNTPLPISLPAPCATWGYNTLTFYDPLNSLSTIDLNNTGKPGFKWYMQVTTGLLMAPGDIVLNGVNNGIIITPTNGSWISTTGFFSPPSSAVVGQPLQQRGGYFQCTMAFSPNNSGGSTAGPEWPAWWIDVTQREINLNVPESLNYPMTEVDVVDYNPNFGPGNGGANAAIWTSNSTSHFNTNDGFQGLPGGFDYTIFHDYGVAFVPTTKNGGTGIFQFYVDGTHLTANDVTYTIGGGSPQNVAGGSNVYVDYQQGMNIQLMIGSGKNWPAKFKNVIACQ